MGLEEQYKEATSSYMLCVQIAENFAIGFSNWVMKRHFDNKEPKTTKELLEIYKKTL